MTASGNMTSAIISAAERLMASDIPEARKCGATMNIAWRESKDKPCTEIAHAAADKMRDMIETCRTLRQGAEYVTSYGELLRTNDKWCGGPHCDNQCGKGEVCFRDRKEPFKPSCVMCNPYAHVGPACDAHDAECQPACSRMRDTFHLARVPAQGANKSSAPLKVTPSVAVASNQTIDFRVNTAMTRDLTRTASGNMTSAIISAAERLMASDIPEARKCGATMNIAWRESKDKPCSDEAHAAADKMRDMIETCRGLRQGAEYVTSYGELLRTNDKWCGGPHCDNACGKGEVCFRDRKEPFKPSCVICNPYAHVGPACDAHDAKCQPACSRMRDTFHLARVPAQGASKGSAPLKVTPSVAVASNQTVAFRVNTTNTRDLTKTASGNVTSAIISAAERLMASDIPEARKCGARMNIAWRESKDKPCSEEAHAAADKMRDMIETCRELRQGAEYVTSYGELLRTSDKW